LPALRGETPRPRTLFWEHEGNRAVREGNWKLVALQGGPWELYDLETDRTELNDLSARHPEIAARLANAWQKWAARCWVDRGAKQRGAAKPRPTPPASGLDKRPHLTAVGD